MSLRDKLLKNSTLADTAMLCDSKIFGQGQVVDTEIPILNSAFSGDVEVGFSSGLTVIAGPSKHFKSNLLLMCAAAFIRKWGKDAIILFYDSEFGSKPRYFESFGIPTDQVVHSPLLDIEQLKHDIMTQVTDLKRGEKVFIALDSLGNLASRKEVEDAVDGKSVADMTRAKQIKSLFRMVTPHLSLKDIPMFAVNHIYMEQGMYPKAIVSGGTGPYLSADDIWIIGRQQDKNDKTKEIEGYNFIIRIEKSRTVKEKSEFPISISYEEGINKWSGLFDVAKDGGYIVSPSKGWFTTADPETGEVADKNFHRADVESSDEFWTKMLNETTFKKYIRNKYQLPTNAIEHETVEEKPAKKGKAK